MGICAYNKINSGHPQGGKIQEKAENQSLSTWTEAEGALGKEGMDACLINLADWFLVPSWG